MVAYVFPGQGSQFKGMGQNLFDQFADLTEKADQVLGYSIKDLCLLDSDGNLAETQFTQPALYVVNAFSYLERLQNDGEVPDFVAGHSLGEYNALYSAGAYDFETGLKIVKERGRLMSEVKDGGMAAVIGITKNDVSNLLDENEVKNVSIANLNAPIQTVISGSSESIEGARSLFEGLGATYIVLNVGGAFHSTYMGAAAHDFQTFLADFKFHRTAVPVISNCSVKPYRDDEIVDNLVNQFTGTVRWTESIQYILQNGETEIIEVGPGETLTGLIGAISRDWKHQAVA